MQVTFILLLALLSGPFGHAISCSSAKWPFSQDVSNLKPQELDSLKRNYLYQYLYYELSIHGAQRTPGLAKKLLFYLKNTELNEDRHQMLGAIEWAADLDTKQPRVIPLSEICSMESKIEREPTATQSSKSKPQPSKKRK